MPADLKVKILDDLDKLMKEELSNIESSYSYITELINLDTSENREIRQRVNKIN